MIEPIFEGVRSRCLRHKDVLLLPGESECQECRDFRALRPPFDVKCIRGGWGAKKDEIYSVIWIVADGKSQYNENMHGYVFRAEGEKGTALHDHVFDPVDFVILKEKKEESKLDESEVDWTMIG